MENHSQMVKRDDDDHQMELQSLPPGFRFHPTDEELITHYLEKKVLDSNFSTVAIGEVDMNKVEPWELPCLRTNRATAAGYWKATGKDREIFRGKKQVVVVGMKKTLVFYKGRAPKGEKSNWVAHEYRLEGKLSVDNHPKSTKNNWVISRVFHKTTGGKNKVDISTLMRILDSQGNDIDHQSSSKSIVPPLMDPSHHVHVHCFSNTSSVVSPAGFLPADDTFSRSQFQDPPTVFFGDYGGNTVTCGLIREEREIFGVSRDIENGNSSSFVPNVVEMRKKQPFEELDEEAPSDSFDGIWSY